MAKRKLHVRKKSDVNGNVETEPVIAKVRYSDEPPRKTRKWSNKQRVLVFSSRGITHRGRHFMTNLRTLLPHSKPDTKMEKKDNLFVVNEICEMKNCNKCIFLEVKKKQDLYFWISNVPNGPSAKFLAENIHTMEELKMTGNCLKGSRSLLSFDKSFTDLPHLALLKELFVQIFGTPYHHPKSQPFIDRVFSFSYLDNRIWFRNYQIIEEDGSLAEIGPRFVLNPVCIFDGSFGGTKLWENPHYVTPNKHRRMVRDAASLKYKNRVTAKLASEERKEEDVHKLDPTDLVFQTISPEEAVGPQKNTFYRKS